MPQKQHEFIERLPEILRLFSNPVTPHTASEMWIRINDQYWDECLPILLHDLNSSDPRVVRLVLSILQKQIEIMGPDTLVSSIPTISKHLNHEDSLVRQATIGLLKEMEICDNQILDGLKSIMENDESHIATEAALAILKLNPDEADGMLSFLIEQLNADDFIVQSLILENIELSGKYASTLLPYITKLLNEEGCEWEASFAYMKITGDDAHVRIIIERWKESENEIIRGTAYELETVINKFLCSF